MKWKMQQSKPWKSLVVHMRSTVQVLIMQIVMSVSIGIITLYLLVAA